jgi:hypothetical protein
MVAFRRGNAGGSTIEQPSSMAVLQDAGYVRLDISRNFAGVNPVCVLNMAQK